MNELHCPICGCRLSAWMLSSGKTTHIGENIVHTSCLIDWKLKYGKGWQPGMPFDGLLAYRQSRGGND